MPDSYAQTPDGLLLVANGVSPVLRWDGLSPQMEPAGVLPPAAGVTLSGSGVGSIVGTYSAYVRFLDRDGNPSDLSPVSAEYHAQRLTGTITGVTNATPVVVTSAAHGLLTGAVVKITGVGGASGINTSWTVTVLDANRFSLNNSVSAGAYTGGGTWVAGVSTLTFTNVPAPAEPKVTRRQILRNTDGQAQTYYVDVDSTDLFATSFTSTRSDEELLTQEAVPLLNADGTPFANRYGVPPAHKAVLAHHLNRMFLGGEVTYSQGSVSVAFGSTTVTGIGTEWTSSLAGRFLYVSGATERYEVASVSETAQTLVLTSPYLGATDAYSSYAIRPAPAERRLVYYSEAGLPEAFPATNALSLQEDGDEITGLMPFGSFLYILERRHIYRFTFQSDPATDGYVFLSTASRGCVNNRCWVVVEDATYMLDEQGVHAFSGGKESEPVSVPVQDLFRRDEGGFAINWAASAWFHAAHTPREDTVRFFVALSGHYLPRHALAFNYRLKRWWIEEYDQPIGASCRVQLDQEARLFLGSFARRVLLSGEGTLDGPDPTATTVRGAASGATLTTLTDATAAFAGLAGFAVTVADGAGKGQTRSIASHTATVLTLTQPWLTLPDATSVYVVGGVRWRWRAGWFRFVEDEQENPRKLAVLFKPTVGEGLLTMRLYFDQRETPAAWDLERSAAEGTGVRVQKGSPDLVAPTTKPNGWVQQRLDGRREPNADGPRFVSPELTGVQGVDRVTIYQVSLDGVQ